MRIAPTRLGSKLLLRQEPIELRNESTLSARGSVRVLQLGERDRSPIARLLKRSFSFSASCSFLGSARKILRCFQLQLRQACFGETRAQQFRAVSGRRCFLRPADLSSDESRTTPFRAENPLCERRSISEGSSQIVGTDSLLKYQTLLFQHKRQIYPTKFLDSRPSNSTSRRNASSGLLPFQHKDMQTVSVPAVCGFSGPSAFSG